MHRYLDVLTVQSVKELFRYKSFFLLIVLLLGADRLLHQFVHVKDTDIKPDEVLAMGPAGAEFVFQTLPAIVQQRLIDCRTVLVLAGMFLFKQLISLWPSSDMRRMHRRERAGLGFVASLLVLRWRQVAWDAVALASVCTVAGSWIVFWFIVCRILWLATAAPAWALVWGCAVLAAAPVLMAGFSYSSKIAVLSEGGFGEKLRLFYRLFLDRRILTHSWLFFMVRCIAEFIFVAAIPGLAMLLIPSFAVRIFVAGLSMVLVYPYLKMATFKFFLHVYENYPAIQQEYAAYYAAQTGAGECRNLAPRREAGTQRTAA